MQIEHYELIERFNAIRVRFLELMIWEAADRATNMASYCRDISRLQQQVDDRRAAAQDVLEQIEAELAHAERFHQKVKTDETSTAKGD